MEYLKAYDRCVAALREFMQDHGFSEVVLGLSGGIDSALVAVMCVDAIGSDRVHALLMPGPYSTTHSLTDAYDIASRLDISAQEVSIREAYESFSQALNVVCEGELQGLASQNTQARCRMVCLMAASNHHGWMVVNTGNKTEAMMGYSTLYGDTCGAFAPIGGLYKTDVYRVARARCERAIAQGLEAPIPEHVFIKPPSAELAPDQEDETSLGIDYETLDSILKAVLEQQVPINDIEGSSLPTPQTKASIKALLQHVTSQSFKRAYEPPFADPCLYR